MWRHLQVQATLLDVLEAEQVDQAECIMVARILLIVGADAKWICMRITGCVVILRLEVRPPRQTLRPIAAAHDRRACMYRIVAVAAALQISGARRIKPERQLRLV